jgi:hypothetical protein
MTPLVFLRNQVKGRFLAKKSKTHLSRRRSPVLLATASGHGQRPVSGRQGEADRAHLPWAREVLFQTVHSVSRFLGLSNGRWGCPSSEEQIPQVIDTAGKQVFSLKAGQLLSISAARRC